MVWKDGTFFVDHFPITHDLVSMEELQVLPKEVAPQLTSRYMQRDVQNDEAMILWIYSEYLKEKNPKKK